MKIIHPRVLTPLVVFAAAASVNIVEGGIAASAYYEDANCTSSPLVINMARDCSGDTFTCPTHDTPGTSDFCIADLTTFFTGLGGARYLVAEYYNDVKCTSLSSAAAYLADGLCHELTDFDGSRQCEMTVVGSNGSVSVVGMPGGCKSSSDKYYYLQSIPSANITGECLVMDVPPRGDAAMTHGAIFYYAPSASSATGSSSSSATESPTPTPTPTTTTNATTATSTSSGASLGFVSTLFCATLTASIALV